MPENDKQLGPRFRISKRRVGDGVPDETFTPDKIIYVELDDEITMVFDRIKRVRGTKIALVIPRRAVVLQSVVNLKILKKKIDELEKEVIVVTSDATGLELAAKAGMQCTERLFEKEQSGREAAEEDAPVFHTERPVKMKGDKISIAEVMHAGRENQRNFLVTFIQRVRERLRKNKNQKETRLLIVAPNKQALFTLILVSIFLLLAIAYIALPGATIEITPRSSVLANPFNITFLNYEKNRELLLNPSGGTITIASYAVRPPPFTKKLIYNATGKLPKGENAHGIITITNLSSTPWDLAEQTRFQTENGIVFRIRSGVRIPPGTLDVSAVADPFDTAGQITGERGNIPPTRFFLPGLKNEENRKKLYGESKNPMLGGTTETVKVVSEEDLKAARVNAVRDVMKGIEEDLKHYLEEENLAKKRNLSLLTDRNVIKISEPVIEIPGNMAGKTIPQFEVTVTYTASAVAFDRLELTSALKERLASRVDPDKKILTINEDDISYRFLEADQSFDRVRLTAEMRAVQVYELDPDKENGHRFIKKITDHILGARVQDALGYLQQQTDEISKVEIRTWPVWAPTIPTIADNVKFVIREDFDLQ